MSALPDDASFLNWTDFLLLTPWLSSPVSTTLTYLALPCGLILFMICCSRCFREFALKPVFCRELESFFSR